MPKKPKSSFVQGAFFVRFSLHCAWGANNSAVSGVVSLGTKTILPLSYLLALSTTRLFGKVAQGCSDFYIFDEPQV
jgi:hypothetical protein